MKIDFVQFCRDNAIPHTHDVADWVNINCPLCHHKGTRGYKGGFNIYGGYYHCWNCGGHSLHEVLIELLSINYSEVEGALEPYSNMVSLRKIINDKKSVPKIELPIMELTSRAKKYLEKRNYDPEYLNKKYGISGSAISGPWAHRLIIPLYFKNKLVSFQGRSLYSKEKCNELKILRYKFLPRNMSIVDPKHMIYNLDNCKKESAILVEGAPDVWRIGDDCMATLGTSTTPEQHLLLCKKRLFIVFDPEPEAQLRAKKLAKAISALKGKTIEIVNTELDHDPGEMTEEEVKYLRKELRL